MTIEEIVERIERLEDHETAREFGLAVAKAVVERFQPLVHAADDLAYCHASGDIGKQCGTCFGCHLLGALRDIRAMLPQDEDDVMDANLRRKTLGEVEK